MSTTVDLGKITASVTVGKTTTGAAGTNASVSNSGTTQDAVLNFTIPRGAQGVQGPQGSTGPQGPAGPTGPQGPMGDVAVITPEQQAAFTMYSEPGQNTNGPMTQKATTDALVNIAEYSTEEIDLSAIPNQGFGVWSGKWHTSNIIFIKHLNVKEGDILRITASTMDSFLVWPTTFSPSNNASVTYTTQRVPANTTKDIVVPDGIQHLCLQDDHAQSNGSQLLPSSVYKVIKTKDKIEEIDDKVAENGLGKFNADDISKNWVSGLLKNDGTVDASTNLLSRKTSFFIELPDTPTDITVYHAFPIGTWCGCCLYDENKNFIGYPLNLPTATGRYNFVFNTGDYPTAKYMRCTPYDSGAITGDDFYVYPVKVKNTALDILGGDSITYGYGQSTEGTMYTASGTRYCSSNTPCVRKGVISRIRAKFNAAGTCRFYTGFVDQNGFLIIKNTFDVSVVSGANNIDVSSRNLYMDEGDYLFVNYADETKHPAFKQDSSVYPKSVSALADMSLVIRTDGVYFSFAWEIQCDISSYEEMTKELVNMNEEIETNSIEIENLKNNKKYFLKDSATGITYQITCRNGQVVLVPMQFSKALILGNSITSHGLRADTWWGVWGMAATKAEYDFVHIIKEGLRIIDANADCVGLNIATWERDFSVNLSTLLSGYLAADTDFVVIRLGENVTNTAGFESALENLINYVYSVASNAKIVITSLYWANDAKDASIITAANNKSIDYIDIRQFGNSFYEESVGHYVYGDDNAIHEITNSGVAQHPSNKGMLAIANSILSAIGYNSVNKTYTLQEVTVGGVTGTMWVLDE